MSEQRTVVTGTGATRQLTEEDKKKAEEEVKRLLADRKEKKAKFVRVIERGFTVDRLHVDLPDNLHGEWVPEDQVDRWQLLGFEVDHEHAVKRQLHPAADGSARVADVVFMTCSKEDFELMQEVKQEIFVKTHGSPKQKERLMQQEEQDFKNTVENKIGLPVIDEGIAREAKKDAIREAIKRPQT